MPTPDQPEVDPFDPPGNYTTVSSDTQAGLIPCVQVLIDRGWSPQGGIATVVIPKIDPATGNPYDHQVTYIQALVRGIKG